MLEVSQQRQRTQPELIPLGELPKGKELEDLVELYFSTVHRAYPKQLTTRNPMAECMD